jgi:CBS domain-containing protein
MAFAQLRVRDLMQTGVQTVNPNDRLLAADQLSKLERVRHLPVVDDDGMLVGIVSQRDIFHSGLIKAMGYGTHGQERVLDVFLVKEAMTTEVVTTAPDTQVKEAAAIMLDKKIGCLPVVDGDRLAGIVTESDFLRLVRDS